MSSEGHQTMPTQTLMMGGEALVPADVAFWQHHYPEVRLVNHFGPTETTVGCCTYDITAPIGKSHSIPIGKPIANTQIYILDPQREPVPVGVTGELYIAGAGLARGYLNRPDLTADRFVPDLFVGGGEGRMYKTGDLGRWLPDGNIEFLGRNDFQVKIRGFRIELGEIEARLAAHRGVRDAVVIASEDTAGDKRLVAYYTTVDSDGAGLGAEALRAYLSANLPEYMVPAAYVRLESLPLMRNGKLNRAALPPPQYKNADALRPRDNLEIRVLQLLEEVVGVRNIGIRDNFFELGGTSLQAVAISARIAKEYGLTLPVRVIFEKPTAELLASFLRAGVRATELRTLVPVQPGGNRPPLFCVHPASGLIHCYIDLARNLGPGQPFYCFQSVGLDDGLEPETDLCAMAALYISDLKAKFPSGPYQIAGLSMGAIVAFEMAQQLARAGDEVSFLGLFDGMLSSRREEFFATGWERSLREFQENYIDRQMEYELAVAPEEFAGVGFSEKVVRYLEGAKAIDRIPSDITVEQFERLLRVFAINARAAACYRAEPYSGNVHLFQSEVPEGADPTFGWAQYVSGEFRIHPFAGSHGNFVWEPAVREFGVILSKCLGSGNEPESSDVELLQAYSSD